jgi:calcineurin-like phosphoesterase family protein
MGYTEDKQLVTGQSGLRRWHAAVQDVSTGAPPDFFLASDMHIGHLNMSKWRGFGTEEAPDVDGHDETVIGLWNDTVKPDDVVLILGDAAMGKLDRSLPMLGSLNGEMFLVPGNHDRMSPAYHHKGDQEVVMAKRADWVRRYEQEGNLTVLPTEMEFEEFDISHFPYEGDHGTTEDPNAEQRYSELRPEARGRDLLHGHVHSEWDIRTDPNSGLEMFNVGLDANGLKPVRLSAIRARLAARKAK